MREKTKVSWEHFYNNYLFTASKEKHVAQQRFIGYVTQGKRREVWGYDNYTSNLLSLYRMQPVAAGCIIGWDAAMPLMQCPPYQYTGAHFADLGRMTD